MFQISGCTDGLRVSFAAPLRLIGWLTVKRVVPQVQVPWTVLQNEHDYANSEHGDKSHEWKHYENHLDLDFAFSLVQLDELFSAIFSDRFVRDRGVFNRPSI